MYYLISLQKAFFFFLVKQKAWLSDGGSMKTLENPLSHQKKKA